MMIEPASAASVRDVALRMRERDFEEFRALSPFDTREDVADALAQRYGTVGDAFCISSDRRPICVAGSLEPWPGVISLLFFATDDFPKVALPVTRFLKRELFPRYEKAGVRRVQATALAGGSEIGSWLQTLGLAPEAYFRRFGKGGEDFIQFAKIYDVRSSGA